MDATIKLLGGFEVTFGGVAVPSTRWSRRHAAAVVKLLALQPGRRMHREQLIDLVWPHDAFDVAVPKLHKAAHFARKAAGRPDVVVLQGDVVHLLPDAEVVIDAAQLAEGARRALAGGDRALAAVLVEQHRGELLPEDRYEEWTVEPREHLRRRTLELLELLERWDDVVALEPGDERAHVALMQAYTREGDRHAALRQFERMDRVLRVELGVQPGPEACAIRDRLLAAGPAPSPSRGRIVGRARELAVVEQILTGGPGAGVLVIGGPPGIGKTALLRHARERAVERGWRAATAVAAPFEGAWPYAPVLDALADLCRREPALLDGLRDLYREEIDRALSGVEAQWSGQTGHQRLFVAVAELARLAAAGDGLLLAIDDLHEADDATLRLPHYVARAVADERLVIVVAHRPTPTFDEARLESLARQFGTSLALGPLDDEGARALAAATVGDAPDGVVDQVVALAAGNPFTVVELARRAVDGPAWLREVDAATITRAVSPATREVLQRVAVVGLEFDTDEFVALSGVDEATAYDHLDAALDAQLLERSETGYRFAQRMVRDALVEDLAPHRRRRIHGAAADRLAQLGASPARIGHHLLAAGETRRAVPHLLAAAETEAAIGAYRDALALIEAVRADASGAERARLLALRADLLMALGDPAAITAYRDALEVVDAGARRLMLARLARVAVMSGDIETAAQAMRGVEPDGGEGDAEILLAMGNVAFFTSDFERAAAIAEEARRRVLAGDKSWQVLDLMSLQALLAHHRGEWFDRVRVELRRTRDVPEIANAVFDGYLCPAEYLLYGPTPYSDVIETARGLRATALRGGALRAVAFASALIGEAALLSGDLDLAATELHEAVDLHHDLGSAAGESHSLQRLAEVHLARGDRIGACELLERALPLARWSIIARHLLQRIYGTMIAAAPDPAHARTIVHRAESTLGADDACEFCTIMLSVPAAIACAACGELDDARRHLGLAEHSAMLWQGTSWQAALDEARAHISRAEGDESAAARLFGDARERFARAGQPLDAARCASAIVATPSPAG